VDLMSIGEFARLSRLSAKAVTLLATTAPVTDASRRGGSDLALPLRDRAGAA
jgi:hypothetical protein